MPSIEELDESGEPKAPAAAEPVDNRPTKRPLDVKAATAGLFACCAAGDAEALQSLFDECVLIDHTAQELDDCKPIPADLRREEDGSTALLVACEGGHLKCVRILLRHGCPPGKANRIGQTPVMAACFRGHPYCLRVLLAARASPTDGSMTDAKGAERTPLVLALDRFSQTGEDDCVKQLLAADERLRLPCQLDDAHGLRYGHKLLIGSQFDIRAAAERRAEAAPYYASALVTSCGSGLVACVERLLKYAAPERPHTLDESDRPRIRPVSQPPTVTHTPSSCPTNRRCVMRRVTTVQCASRPQRPCARPRVGRRARALRHHAAAGGGERGQRRGGACAAPRRCRRAWAVGPSCCQGRRQGCQAWQTCQGRRQRWQQRRQGRQRRNRGGGGDGPRRCAAQPRSRARRDHGAPSQQRTVPYAQNSASHQHARDDATQPAEHPVLARSSPTVARTPCAAFAGDLVGQVVRLHDLAQKEALNGREGLVEDYDVTKARLVVRLRPEWNDFYQEHCGPFLLRFSNLTPLGSAEAYEKSYNRLAAEGAAILVAGIAALYAAYHALFGSSSDASAQSEL